MMLTHTNLKKGVKIILDGEPYEVLEARPLKKAQRRPVIQTKIKNLISNNVFDKNFHQGDTLEEAKLTKLEVKFLYCHRDRYFFCEVNELPEGHKGISKRFDLTSEQIGSQSKFLKPNQIVEALIFNEKVINISLPIKIQLKVTEAPPGIRGDRAQGGFKIVTLETGAKISTPLFIKEGDVVEINTSNEEYTKRVNEAKASSPSSLSFHESSIIE